MKDRTAVWLMVRYGSAALLECAWALVLAGRDRVLRLATRKQRERRPVS